MLNLAEVASGMRTLLWIHKGANWIPTDDHTIGPIGAAGYLISTSGFEIGVEVDKEIHSVMTMIGRSDASSQTVSAAAVCRVAVRHGFTDADAVGWAAWPEIEAEHLASLDVNPKYRKE